MQNVNAITKFLATLFLIFMIWVAYSLISMVFQEHTNENHNYVPEDANFVLRIDARKLINSSISSILLTEDEEIVDLLKKTFEDEHDTKLERLGIAINSDLIIFKQSFEGHDLVGILFNLTGPKTFKKNVNEYLDGSQVYAIKDNVGLVYFEMENLELKELSKNSLQKKADKILEQKSKFKFDYLETDKESVMAQIWSKQGPSDDSKESNVSFIITDHKLIIDGELGMDFGSKGDLQKEVSPSGIHISTDQMSDVLNDTLTSLLSDFNLPLSNITGFSINYHGLELLVEPVFFAAPKFDALIAFEDSISIDRLVDSLLVSEEMVRISENAIQYKGLDLYYKQIDSNSIYIGTREGVEIIERKENLAFHMTGVPSLLTKIKGKGMMLSFFELIPAYTSSRDFTQRAEHIDIQLSNGKNGISKLHGEIKFRKDEFALNSVLKLLIQAR